ncbi:FAD-dependent oxidoreductase [Bosea psychrotolerans]|uniref:Cation diffusion facilitator CzcD-associated flavoprotein CzcO n=1 Tax=Bosea psychrotolerans TaxID=1871628 RepID=A0A2S4MAS8_9HYPH|nr:NAD(P)/FAD-dependent oxidoreductase [Bosea psychrotolerans]POR51842.1 cation diffusion facilitator CzcD-associated flavoprotein CzcO [Bosea psychrotolerans]
MRHDGLSVLESRIAGDLARTAHPSAPWLEPVAGPGGQPAYDVIVVGGGQSGLATAFGLQRSQVTNILVLDKAAAGQEGPWRSYARMHTLRSPKDFTGPDLDVPSLTYQSWHEAKFGVESWDELTLIPKGLWADYLGWFRHVVGIPVRNEAEVVDITPAAGLLAVTLRCGGKAETLHTRKIVLATGQESLGDWTVPAPLMALPSSRCVHCAEPIDFAALAGKRVAVIGAGASAFDNAATALEAGAAQVHLLCRRPQAQVIQPYRWLTFRGFLRHLSDLDDAWRWRFMSAVLALREGFPQATYDRCARHDAFSLHLGAPALSAIDGPGGVEIAMPQGSLTVDFVIAAAGIEIDLSVRPELAGFAGNIASWADRYAPPAAERDERLGRFPYLGDDYALTERVPGATPWISDIHLFSIASTMSFGASGSSINAMTTAVPKLVSGITRGLFRADVERHWASFQAYDVPQAVLR